MERVLIRIIPVSSESVHLYNRTYFFILVGDFSCYTSDSDDDVTMMVDLQGHKVCGECTWENRPTDLVAAAISVDPKIKPSQIQENAILTSIRKCC